MPVSSRGETTNGEHSHDSSVVPDTPPVITNSGGLSRRVVVVTIAVALAVLVVLSIVQTTTYNARESELLSEKTALVAENRALEGRLKALRLESDAGEQKLTDVAAAVAVTLTGEKANLKNRVQELEERQSTLKTRIDDLIEERQELTRLVAELSAVKGQFEVLSEEIGELGARSKKLGEVGMELGGG